MNAEERHCWVSVFTHLFVGTRPLRFVKCACEESRKSPWEKFKKRKKKVNTAVHCGLFRVWKIRNSQNGSQKNHDSNIRYSHTSKHKEKIGKCTWHVPPCVGPAVSEISQEPSSPAPTEETLQRTSFKGNTGKWRWLVRIRCIVLYSP